MHKLVLILNLILFIGCGKVIKSKNTGDSVEDISHKSLKYIQLVEQRQDVDGFILSDKCDSLLFTGLLSAAVPSLKINIYKAYDSESDTWHRRPAMDCGPLFDNSRSSISRDMMLGVMWSMWKSKDLLGAESLLNSLKANNYMLKGSGSPGERFMTPLYISTLAMIVEELGGSYSLESEFPVTYSKDGGFIAHLAVWHILLRGEVSGVISDTEYNILKLHWEREPKNPLFQAAYHKYTDGNQMVAISQLLDKSRFPANSLPTNHNYCTDWLIQRDFNPSDWDPCPEKENQHMTGMELVVIYELIIKN